ncbi:MAG: J domain-containing protein [Chromatiaceae bacterium]
MNGTDRDFYEILNILPDAESVVVTAAYRALAQRYHPDRWQGDPSIADARMSEINVAYEVLSNAARRAAYDLEKTGRGKASEFDDEDGQAFSTVSQPIEDRWVLATSVYPDLTALRSRLAKVSASLAFAYVVTLLENKSFEQREVYAEGMEHAFLTRYFGNDPAILEFAKKLIFSGQRAAAKALNALVGVLGSSADAKRIIQRITVQFDLVAVWSQQEADRERQAVEQERQSLLDGLRRSVRAFSVYTDARALAEHLGYRVSTVRRGLFQPTDIAVTASSGNKETYSNRSDFIEWVRKELC